MDFEKLDEVARHLMKRRKAHPERETGSVYDHGKRVARLIITLRKAVIPDDDSMDDILRLAGMFHDIGKGIEPHAAYGAPIMMQAVKGLVSEREAQEAARLIEAHCDRRPDGSGCCRMQTWWTTLVPIISGWTFSIMRIRAAAWRKKLNSSGKMQKIMPRITGRS